LAVVEAATHAVNREKRAVYRAGLSQCLHAGPVALVHAVLGPKLINKREITDEEP